MSCEEGTGSSKHFIIKNLEPDWCFSPNTPVPYDIVGILNESTFTSPNVRFKGVPVFDMASRVTTVWGNEKGIGGGVVSGVNKGFCRPEIPVDTVRCNGFHTCRHELTLFSMNCAGPDGPGNTTGKVIYLGAKGSASVSALGKPCSDGSKTVTAETPSELSCFPSLDRLSVGKIASMASKAYELSTVDWKSPTDALGAIGGLSGCMGYSQLSTAIGFAKKGGQLVQTDFSDPGKVLGAAMDIAGSMFKVNRLPQKESKNTGLSSDTGSLGSNLLDVAAKLATLPNNQLGLAMPGIGEVGKAFSRELSNSNDSASSLIGDTYNYINNHAKTDSMLPKINDGLNSQIHQLQSTILGTTHLPGWGLGAAAAIAKENTEVSKSHSK